MFVKGTLLKLTSDIDHYASILVNFNIPLSPMDKSTREKLNSEIRLIDIVNQMSLTDIYRTFPTNTK